MEKYSPTASLSGYPKIDNENDFIECTQNIEKLKIIFMKKISQMII